MGKLQVFVSSVIADMSTNVNNDTEAVIASAREAAIINARRTVSIITALPIDETNSEPTLSSEVEEFITLYSNYPHYSIMLLSAANLKKITTAAANELLILYQGLSKAIKEEKSLVVIYYPEAFLDNVNIEYFWNTICNIVKKTELNILVRTHLDYYIIEKMNNSEEMEPTINLTTRLYLEEPKNSGLIESIINWIRKIFKK